jgi:murein peptide amidase A
MGQGDVGQRSQLLEAVEALALDTLLGQSTEGRPIRATRVGPAGGPATLLAVAGVHGDEPATVEGAVDLLLRIRTGALAVAHPFWLVPVLNPDGLLRGVKNNARDVDLNRNFPAANFSTEHRPGYSPGPVPLSEPETRALAALVEGVGIDRVVAVHAPFACVNFDGPAQDWAEVVSRACGWPARADIGYPTPGSLGSWLGCDRGLAILTLELPPGPTAGFAAACRAALAAAVGATSVGDSPGAAELGIAMNRERIR